MKNFIVKLLLIVFSVLTITLIPILVFKLFVLYKEYQQTISLMTVILSGIVGAIIANQNIKIFKED